MGFLPITCSVSSVEQCGISQIGMHYRLLGSYQTNAHPFRKQIIRMKLCFKVGDGLNPEHMLCMGECAGAEGPESMKGCQEKVGLASSLYSISL